MWTGSEVAAASHLLLSSGSCRYLRIATWAGWLRTRLQHSACCAQRWRSAAPAASCSSRAASLLSREQVAAINPVQAINKPPFIYHAQDHVIRSRIMRDLRFDT